MSLIPYDPFRHLDNMRREFDRFFTTGLPSVLTSRFPADFGAPSIDIYETENEVVASCDIPGLEKKEDVDIHIENNILSISGSINRENEVKEDQMHRKERFVGRFQRSVALPAPVSSEGIKATYKNGVLQIRLLKEKGEDRKRIDVEFH